MRVVLSSVHCWPDVRRGGERYLHELGAGLLRAGHDVRILSTGGSPRRTEVLGVPVHRLPVRRLRRYGELEVQAAFGLQSLAHLAPGGLLGRYDVWHATSTADGAAAALTSRTGRVRSVFTDHGFPASRSREQRSDRALHRYLVDHVDAYVCVSAAAGDYLRSDFGREAVVVPPGVRLDAHAPGTRDRRPTLLYAGDLAEQRKGVQPLVEAAAELRTQVPELQLWLLGPGDPARAMAAAPEGLVTRCELVDDVTLREAYARAWVTVLPSVAESFGMTVVESLASGTPAVVRADGGGPAEIVSSPDVGRLAGPEVADLAAACAEALELAGRPGTPAACRERARDFDWDAAVVPAMTAVYAA
ncbi:MAG TPA: glycosyltransferase family 4 protein [Mycobacteriales bacterium]|nr:glycosyltransferase family 4 protein [Mycobacteriales bacterium]